MNTKPCEDQVDSTISGVSHRVTLLPSDQDISITDVLEMLGKWGSFSDMSLLSAASASEKVQSSMREMPPTNVLIRSFSLDSSTSKISASPKARFTSFDRMWPYKLELRNFQPHKTSNASPDEINFCLLVRNQGPVFAIKTASGLGWKCERPLRDLRESHASRVSKDSS